MTELPETATSGDNPLRAVVTNYGNLEGPSKGIPEEHQPYAEQVLKMDPIRDVPANIRAEGAKQRPLDLKVTALPEDMQSEVYRKLDLLPKMSPADKAKHESRLVAEAIEARQSRLRSVVGVHPDALPFHKEQVDIAMQVRDLYRKRDGFQEALDKVVDVEKDTDPETGEVIARPVYWLSTSKRTAYEYNIADIDRQIRLLVQSDGSFGIEGRKRMSLALAESAALLHKRDTARSEEAEARKLAAQMARDDRVKRRADTLVRMGKTGVE